MPKTIAPMAQPSLSPPSLSPHPSAYNLADAGCPTNEYSTEAVGMAPLHWAATEGRLRASAWLLGPGGADPEGRDNQVTARREVDLF